MEHLRYPTLILDKKKCIANIERMALKAKAHQVKFRPHFKTHASAEIGNWYRDFGVTGITVSSVRMAGYFAQNGWDDITIAFPVNLREIGEINELAGKIKLNLLVESLDTIEFLMKNLKSAAGIFIEIDTGYPRTGVRADNFDLMEKMLKKVHPSIAGFKGFLTHSGQTYSATSKEEILQLHQQVLYKLNDLRNHFSGIMEDVFISTGDTPSCSVAHNFEGINEIRPGNFVFYDVMQEMIGSCDANQIAVAIACPVVAKYPDRNQMVVYGGSVHLSKEMLVGKTGERIFGKVVKLMDNGWEEPYAGAFVSSLSQEHGIITATVNILNSYSAGDLIGILPVHSCLTAHAMKHYLTTDNEHIAMMD